jgi:hypothetical protein
MTSRNDSSKPTGDGARAALLRSFEFRLPLSWLLAAPTTAASAQTAVGKAVAAPLLPASRLKLRFSLWHNGLPVDALPMEGWIELRLVSEAELEAGL